MTRQARSTMASRATAVRRRGSKCSRSFISCLFKNKRPYFTVY